jgi:hypothetical protein
LLFTQEYNNRVRIVVEESWIDDVSSAGATDDTVDESTTAGVEASTVFTSVPATAGGSDV